MVRERILKSPAFLEIYGTKDIDSIKNMSLDNMISAATLMLKMIIRVKTSQKYEDMTWKIYERVSRKRMP